MQASLSVNEAAQRVGVPERSLRNWIRAGKVRTVEAAPPLRGARVPVSEVEFLMANAACPDVEIAKLRQQLREAYERAEEIAAENARLHAVASERASELEFLRGRLVQAERAAEEGRIIATRATKALERAQQQLAASPAQQLAELANRIAGLAKGGSVLDSTASAAEERFGIQRHDLYWFGGWTPEGARWIANADEALIFTDLEAAQAECAHLKRRGDAAHVLWVGV